MRTPLAVLIALLGSFTLQAQDKQEEFVRSHYLDVQPVSFLTNQPNIAYEYRFSSHFAFQPGFGFYRQNPVLNQIFMGMFSTKPFLRCGPEFKLAFRYYPGKSAKSGFYLHGFIHGAYLFYNHEDIREGGASSYGYNYDGSEWAYQLTTGALLGCFFNSGRAFSVEWYAGVAYRLRDGRDYVFSRTPDYYCTPYGCPVYPLSYRNRNEGMVVKAGMLLSWQLKKKAKH